MAKQKKYVAVGSRNVTYINGDRYYGEVRLYSAQEEREFNLESTDMISVGNDDEKMMWLPALQCRFDSGLNPPHHNAVNCDVVSEPDSEAAGDVTG